MVTQFTPVLNAIVIYVTGIGNRPHSPRATALLTELLTPRKYLQNSLCTDSIMLEYSYPHISEPKQSMDFTIASNKRNISSCLKYPDCVDNFVSRRKLF